MKILYTNFHLGWGGQALQVLLLAKAMADRGHAVQVFAPPESELAGRAATVGVPVSTACRFARGFRPLQLLRDVRALRGVIRTAGVDVVHCHGSQDSWVAAGATRGLAPRPRLVRTKHNSYAARRHGANRWLYNAAFDRTVAVAGPIRDGLVSQGFVAPGRVVVIHAGLDDAFAAAPRRDAAAVRREFGIAADAPLVCLVGRLAPDKGQDVLLDAALVLRERWPGFRVLLVGTGGDWDRLRGLIEAKGLGETVVWAGFQEDIASITAACDVAVLAARDCDASSTVVKEALVLGVPVVATRVGGTAELLGDGACGRLVPPGDAAALAEGIADVLAEPDTAAGRAAAGREHVQRFLASAVAAETEALYASLLAEGPR